MANKNISRTLGIFKLDPTTRKSEFLHELKKEYSRLSEFVINTYIDELKEDGKYISKTTLYNHFKKTGCEYDLTEMSYIQNRTMLEGMLEKIATTLQLYEKGHIERPSKVDCLHFRTRIAEFVKTEKGHWGITIKHPNERGKKVFIRIIPSDYNEERIKKVIDAGAEDTFTCEIIEKKGEWYLHAKGTLMEQPDLIDHDNIEHIVGVDTGIRNIAVVYVMNRVGDTKLVKFFKDKALFKKRMEYDRKLSEVQRIGKKKTYNRIAGSKKNMVDYANHVVSRAIVNIAEKFDNSIIVFEDLSGSIKTMPKTDFEKKMRGNWSPSDLILKTEYKAIEKGIEVIKINPKYTSTTCPKCATVDKDNRDHNNHNFKCICCGYELNDDLIGAMNIAKRGVAQVSG